MADEHIAAVAPTEGSNSVAGGRASLIAELEQIGASEPQVETPDAPVDTATQSDPSEAGVSGDSLPDKPVEETHDADTTKRLAVVQKAEKRLREQLAFEKNTAKQELAAERAAFEQQRREFTDKLDRFEKLSARARLQPADVLAELGVGDDDFEATAQALYLRRKGAEADPKNRDAAVRLQREREQGDALKQMQSQMAELRAEIKARDDRASNEQSYRSWFGGITKAASEETPLFKSAMEKNPARTETLVQQLAEQHYQTTGEWPDASDVLTAYETQRRAELEELGIDVASVVKSRKKAPANTNAAPPKATLGDVAPATTKVPVKTEGMSRQDKRAQMVRELEEIEAAQRSQAEE